LSVVDRIRRSKPAEPVVDLAEPLPLRLLRARLGEIDRRLAALPVVDLSRHQRDAHGNVTNMTAREREILRLGDALETLRRTTANAVEDATARPNLDEARRVEAQLDFTEAEQRAVTEAQLARLAEQGEWSGWAQRYLAAAFLRERVAAEAGLVPMPSIYR